MRILMNSKKYKLIKTNETKVNKLEIIRKNKKKLGIKGINIQAPYSEDEPKIIFNINPLDRLINIDSKFDSDIENIIENYNNVNYYVIHILSDNTRHKNIINHIKRIKLKINIFDAIEGKKIISNDVFINELKINQQGKFKPGEIGCYLSHLSLLYTIKDDDNYTVIFEDDFKIEDCNFENYIQNIINKIDIDFDILFLGDLTNNYDEQYKDNIYKINKAQNLWGTHGYLLKNKNIKKIIDNLIIFNDVYDIRLKKLIDDHIINGLIINPNLVFQDRSILSTIRVNKINPVYLLKKCTLIS